MDVGERIKKARKLRNLTQKQLGQKIGVAEITIRKYEANKREPNLDSLKQIASVLGIPIAYLTGDVDDPNDRSLTHWAELAVNPGNPEWDQIKKQARHDGILQHFDKLDDNGQIIATGVVKELTEIPPESLPTVEDVIGRILYNGVDFEVIWNQTTETGKVPQSSVDYLKARAEAMAHLEAQSPQIFERYSELSQDDQKTILSMIDFLSQRGEDGGNKE